MINNIFIFFLSLYFLSISYADVDECITGVAQCDQECRNTEGSFVCYCKDGYRMVRWKKGTDHYYDI